MAVLFIAVLYVTKGSESFLFYLSISISAEIKAVFSVVRHEPTLSGAKGIPIGLTGRTFALAWGSDPGDINHNGGGNTFSTEKDVHTLRFLKPAYL